VLFLYWPFWFAVGAAKHHGVLLLSVQARCRLRAVLVMMSVRSCLCCIASGAHRV
jgi:hypothetical protein